VAENARGSIPHVGTTAKGAEEMSEKIIPNGDNVLLEIVEQDKTAGGLYIPDKARGNQRDAVLGKVIGVGKGRLSEYGARIVPDAKEGDYVLLARGAGVEVELVAESRGKDAKKLRIIRDCELLGTVEKSRIISMGLVTP
jgi:co-chaperonin GroES (HSP10)